MMAQAELFDIKQLKITTVFFRGERKVKKTWRLPNTFNKSSQQIFREYIKSVMELFIITMQFLTHLDKRILSSEFD